MAVVQIREERFLVDGIEYGTEHMHVEFMGFNRSSGYGG